MPARPTALQSIYPGVVRLHHCLHGVCGVTCGAQWMGTAHQPMTTATPTATQPSVSFLTDCGEAHDVTCDAYNAIEALQGTDVWLSLPLNLQRQLSAAHATLGGIATALEEWA